MNRLTSASTVGSAGYAAWSLAFTYDRYGNRTNQSGTLNSLTPTGITTNQMTSDTYDANGNLTVENTTPNNGYQYDAENRLIGYSSGGATVATYAFDGNNLRVQKTQGSTVTTYIFSGGKVIAEYAGSTLSKEYVYAGSQLLATIAGGTTTYHHVDHLSVRLTTDSTGAKIGEQGHYPFGEQWYANSTTTKWQFTGYERDAESGNDYAMFRYYSNRTGRFLPPDPAGLAAVDPSDPQSWNQYAYGLNDPIDLVDPLGLCPAPGVYSKKCVYVQRIGGSYNCSVDGAMTDCGLAFSLIATGAAYPTSTPDGQQCYQINDQIYCGTLQRVPDVGVVFNGSKFDPIAYLSSLFPVSVDGSTNNQSTSADCRYVDPGSAGIEITFKVGAAVEAGPVSVGLNEFTKTLGEKGMGSSIEFGVKGILSLQGKRDNAYSSGPMSWTLSAFGFAKDLRTPFFSSSGWTFQPAKEFKIGIQLIGGVEIGYNSEKAKQQDERNIACGYKNGPPGNHYHF